MRKILPTLTLMLLSFSVFAQKKTNHFKVGVGVDAGIPIGDFGKDYNHGVGGSVKLAYHFNPKTALILQTGYMSFVGQNTNYSVLSHATSFKPTALGFILVPLKLGYRTTVANGFFFEPQAGITTLVGGGTNVTFAFSAGYTIAPGLDVSGRFEAISAEAGSLSFVGIGASYNFPLFGK